MRSPPSPPGSRRATGRCFAFSAMPAPARRRSPVMSPTSANGDVVFAAFTGKAAHVMRGKGCRDAGTIHSLIYRLRGEDEDGPTFVLNDDSAAAKAAMIVIDECSMVDEEIGHDLLSFGMPILVLGDPAQLPPVAGGGFFTGAEPDVMLTEVHRQAADDPIIRLSMIVREGGAPRGWPLRREQRRRPRRDRPGGGARRRPGAGRPQQHAAELQRPHPRAPQAERAAAGRRRQARLPPERPQARAPQRQPLARRPGRASRGRALLRYTLSPEEGEDGKGRTVVSINPAFFDGTAEALTTAERRRSDEFDFGYVLTVHKAQGSQWDDVISSTRASPSASTPNAGSTPGSPAPPSASDRALKLTRRSVWRAARSPGCPSGTRYGGRRRPG